MNKETHHAAPATARLRCECIVTMAFCGRWGATARGRVQSMPRDNQPTTPVKHHCREHVDVASITLGIGCHSIWPIGFLPRADPFGWLTA